MNLKQAIFLTGWAWLLFVLFACVKAQSPVPPAGRAAAEQRVVIESEGWQIIGDLLIPRARRPVPAVLLCNGAGRDRKVYESLARRLAERGIASLRLDLRAEGESINKGRFVPGAAAENEKLALENSHHDVAAALKSLKRNRAIDARKIGFVGASYSGEEIAIASRKQSYGQAYVMLSPGSFSEESIAAVDRTNVPWWFIVSNNERYLKGIVAALRQQSRTSQITEMEGTAHATDILKAHPDLAEKIAAWFADKLLARQ